MDLKLTNSYKTFVKDGPNGYVNNLKPTLGEEKSSQRAEGVNWGLWPKWVLQQFLPTLGEEKSSQRAEGVNCMQLRGGSKNLQTETSFGVKENQPGKVAFWG